MSISKQADNSLFAATVAINRKRGRPAKYASAENADLLAAFNGNTKPCRRTNQNRCNMARAFRLIGKFKNGAEVLDYFKKRQTLLSDIGRIKDPETLGNVAYQIAIDKLRGKAAKNLIRSARGMTPKTAENLFDLVSDAVWKYKRINPGESNAEVSANLKLHAESISSFLLRNPAV